MNRIPRHIGYIVNFSSHVWYHVVQRYIRMRAAELGIPEVTILDAQHDLGRELKALDSLIAKEVDALIVTPVPGPGTEAIAAKAQAANIPMVVEANPVEGMSTLVAICDYDAGWKIGEWTGRYLESRNTKRAVVLDIAYPALRPCLLRSEGFFEGLRSIIPNAILKERVNGEARVDIAKAAATEVLTSHPEVNVVFGMDDESIEGALEAAKSLGRDVDDTVLVGFGLAGDADRDKLMNGGHFKASLAMFPEWVGVRCVDQAVRLFNGESVALHDVAPTIPLTGSSLPTYYRKTGEGWRPIFEAINGIEREGRCGRE